MSHPILESEEPQSSPLPAEAVVLDTTEARWFVAGTVPAPFVDWFSFSGRSAIVEVRSDTYWVDGSPDTGLKHRGHGPLELKLRRGRGPELSVGPNASAVTEEWRKIWPADDTPGIPGPTGVWSEVDKAVLTRTYHLRAESGVSPDDERDMTVPGCDIELASILIKDMEAWSFALEAWGSETERWAALQGALSAFRRETPIPNAFLQCLSADMGYPEWLASVIFGGAATA